MLVRQGERLLLVLLLLLLLVQFKRNGSIALYINDVLQPMLQDRCQLHHVVCGLCGLRFSIGVWSYFQLIDFTDKSTVFRSWLLNDAGRMTAGEPCFCTRVSSAQGRDTNSSRCPFFGMLSAHISRVAARGR